MTAESRRRLFLAVAGLSGALAVAAGAYAAHGLQGAAQELVDKASRFQLYHSLALLAVAQLQQQRGWAALASGLLFCLGIVLFCGALYAIGLFGLAAAPLAPFGGSSLILGWLALALSAAGSGGDQQRFP